MEVRWFFAGTPGADVLGSFVGDGELPAERRADLYLDFRGNDSLGFKLRDLGEGGALLELKVRTTPSRLLTFRGGQQGHCAAWLKWSSALQGASGQPPAPARDEHWLRVEKTRRLRKVAWSDGSISEAAGSSRPGEGCTYELTTLLLHDAPWWTLGLEAFGSAVPPDAILPPAAEWFFARYPPRRPLLAEDSRSYPEWLWSI